MRKLAVALAVSAAVLFAGGVAWKADAATWTGTLNLPSAAKNYSPIETTAGAGIARLAIPGVAVRSDAGAGPVSLVQSDSREAAAIGGLAVLGRERGKLSPRLGFASPRDSNNLRFTVGSESPKLGSPAKWATAGPVERRAAP
jgi:hypothetical protein